MRSLTPLMLVLVVGCASRSELETVRALLDECRTDKSVAQDAAFSCQDRYDREVRRWEDTDALLAEVLPRAMQDFEKERRRIVELIPEQTRDEVEGYLDGLADGMARGFQVLKEENEAVLLQLEVAQTKLDVLGARTDSLGEQTASLGETAASISTHLEEALEERHQREIATRRALAGLVARIHDFDSEFINDRSSPDRLKLNRNQRETIKGFHDLLVTDLSGLSAAR